MKKRPRDILVAAGLALAFLCAAPGRAQTNLIVFVGDSITYECDWAARLGDSQIVNRGVPGDTTRDILARLDTVADPRARAYLIMAGINDLKYGIPRAETISNIRKMIRILRQTSPDAAIILQSILPVNRRVRPFTFKTSLVKDVNDDLRKIACEKARVVFLDLYPLFLDERGRLKKELTRDGLHLNAAGYDVWVERLRREGFLPPGPRQ